jgi:hypothetical protein
MSDERGHPPEGPYRFEQPNKHWRITNPFIRFVMSSFVVVSRVRFSQDHP